MCYDVGEATYLVEIYDHRNEAETRMEQLAEEYYVQAAETGDLGEGGFEPIYRVVEIEPETLTTEELDQIERGVEVRIT